jgi:hypothetical protein
MKQTAVERATAILKRADWSNIQTRQDERCQSMWIIEADNGHSNFLHSVRVHIIVVVHPRNRRGRLKSVWFTGLWSDRRPTTWLEFECWAETLRRNYAKDAQGG